MNESKFSPEWSFMDNPDLKRIQLLLDDSISGNTTSDREESFKNFIAEWNRVMEQCLSQESITELLREVLHFIDVNRKYFDKGGMNIGRSTQSNILDESLSKMLDKFPTLRDE